jgi:hypothetical protein
MFITEAVSKGSHGKSYTSILLRQSYRVGAAVKSKTLAVLTHLPAHVLEAVRLRIFAWWIRLTPLGRLRLALGLMSGTLSHIRGACDLATLERRATLWSLTAR